MLKGVYTAEKFPFLRQIFDNLPQQFTPFLAWYCQHLTSQKHLGNLLEHLDGKKTLKRSGEMSSKGLIFCWSWSTEVYVASS